MESKLEASFDSIGDCLEEEVFCEESGTAEENEFDFAVGAIEDVLLDDEFTEMQNDFCRRYCDEFDDDEENKIIYTDIFQQFTSLIESTLERMLESRIPGFNMRNFECQLASRKDEISGEIFDLLLSLGEFTEFKEMMLSYKRSQNEAKGVGGISISGRQLTGTGKEEKSGGRSI